MAKATTDHADWCLGYSPKYSRCHCGAQVKPTPRPTPPPVAAPIPCGEATEVAVENLTMPMELPPK